MKETVPNKIKRWLKISDLITDLPFEKQLEYIKEIAWEESHFVSYNSTLNDISLYRDLSMVTTASYLIENGKSNIVKKYFDTLSLKEQTKFTDENFSYTWLRYVVENNTQGIDDLLKNNILPGKKRTSYLLEHGIKNHLQKPVYDALKKSFTDFINELPRFILETSLNNNNAVYLDLQKEKYGNLLEKVPAGIFSKIYSTSSAKPEFVFSLMETHELLTGRYIVFFNEKPDMVNILMKNIDKINNNELSHERLGFLIKELYEKNYIQDEYIRNKILKNVVIDKDNIEYFTEKIKERVINKTITEEEIDAFKNNFLHGFFQLNKIQKTHMCIYNEQFITNIIQDELQNYGDYSLNDLLNDECCEALKIKMMHSKLPAKKIKLL